VRIEQDLANFPCIQKSEVAQSVECVICNDEVAGSKRGFSINPPQKAFPGPGGEGGRGGGQEAGRNRRDGSKEGGEREGCSPWDLGPSEESRKQGGTEKGGRRARRLKPLGPGPRRGWRGPGRSRGDGRRRAGAQREGQGCHGKRAQMGLVRVCNGGIVQTQLF
jgi:hypothetical protein